MSYSLFCVQAPLMTHGLACAACPDAWFEPHSHLSFVLLCPFKTCPLHASSASVLYSFSGLVSMGRLFQGLSLHKRLAPAGPLIFVHDVASHTCLVQAALPIDPWKLLAPRSTLLHMTVHAPFLLITSKNKESETDGFFPAAPAKCLRIFFLGWRHAWGFQSPTLCLAPQPFARLCWYLFSSPF